MNLLFLNIALTTYLILKIKEQKKYNKRVLYENRVDYIKILNSLSDIKYNIKKK